MDVAVIDFETFWSKDHTLSKMSAIDYVMHPQTEIISMAIKINNEPTTVIFGEDNIAAALGCIDWSDKIAVGHNMSGFDSMILAWRFGVKPRMWGCTLAMARPIHAITVGNSLAKLVGHYKLGAKDKTALVQTQGKRFKDFTPDELAAMEAYNRADTEQCAALFKILRKEYTARELWHIDATIRMLVEPAFKLDKTTLQQALTEERNAKSSTLYELYKMLRKTDAASQDIPPELDDPEEYVRDQLASAPKFSALLKSQGVEVPMKVSPTDPNRMTPALAKTDDDFLKLQEHPNPVVAAAARARLSVKSTLLETRIEAFLSAANAVKGKLPIPLNYCGATTTGRWSGWLFNPQNLPRIPRDKEGNIIHKASNALRLSMQAPEGHKVIVADLSGIELRVNHFLWKVSSSMYMYSQDAQADLYRAFAAARYDIEPQAVTKDQRQLAKVAQLGLGFGAGAATFRKVAKLMGGLDLSEGEAVSIVNDWRAEYSAICDGWQAFQDALPSINQGVSKAIDPWGMCVTHKGAVRLPSGRYIRYPSLVREIENGKTQWWYGEGRHRARIYAGKGVENLVQALARDIIADNAMQFRKDTGLTPALMVHDELVYVVPDDKAQPYLDRLQEIMRTPPTWWPELITWSEGDIAQRYGEAK